MSNLQKEGFNYALIVLVFPLLSLFITYYGFESSYVRLKHLEQAPDFMFSSVYAYRIIPNFIGVELTHFLQHVVDNYLEFLKPVLLKNGTIYYHSVFLTNAVFFGISFVLFERILRWMTREHILTKERNLLFFLLGVFYVCMTQYVPTNGDSIALAFLLFGAFFSLKYKKENRPVYLGLIVLAIFGGTFVRETACLNISFFAALFVNPRTLKGFNKRNCFAIFLLVMAFIIPYILIRTVLVKQDSTLFEGIYILQNFTSPFNVIGLIYGGIGLWLCRHLIKNEVQYSMFYGFLLWSMPYFVMLLFVGLFWEIRLFLPVLMLALGLVAGDHKRLKSII